MSQLQQKAWTTHIFPSLSPNSLMSMKALADNGYVTIFHPHDEAVTVYNSNDIVFSAQREASLPVYQEQHGLWRIPLVDKVTNMNTQTIALDRPLPAFAINNVYADDTQSGSLSSCITQLPNKGYTPCNYSKHFPL
ncbi:hypothetical protein ACHAWX_000175 [Stephanocyclus meneghinianus]